MITHCFTHPTGLLQFAVYNDNEQFMGALGCQLITGDGEHWGVIRDLLIYEQFQRQGAATYLLTAVTKRLADPAKRLGIELPPLEMLLAIIPVHANIAVRVFERCGFEQIGKTATSVAYQFTFRRQHAVIPIH